MDFFVHTCPWHSMAMQGPNVVDLYEIGLGQQVEELCVDSADGNTYPLKSFRDFYGVYTHTHTHTHTHTQRYVYVYASACVYIRIYVCMYA